MTNHNEVSPFLTNEIGVAAGDDEVQIKYLDEFSSNQHMSSSNSGQDSQ
jgi:hypothetical protein